MIASTYGRSFCERGSTIVPENSIKICINESLAAHTWDSRKESGKQ